MGFSARLQFLACLVLYASSAQAIMVKFGTKGGPIEPPTPEPELPAKQPYRAPAPVWEERSNDAPDPNAQWRPQLFKPQPLYTQTIYQSPVQPALPPVPINNAQRFVNAYLPANQRQNYFIPPQVLGTQSLPGIGLRYFVPYVNEQRIYKQEDAKLNHVDTNDITHSHDSASDLQWKYEKDLTRRNLRTAQESGRPVPVYVFPAYVPRQQ